MLRPDHLGCYGYSRKTSPALDALAGEGVLFENAISSTSWTLPAHAALFTSLPDTVHGCTETDKKLAEEIVTLAERFGAAGYRTAGFFSGPYLHPAFGLGQGFERYENCTSYAAKLDRDPVSRWAMDRDVMHSSHRDITNPIVYPAFKEWLARNGGSRFFAFVHLWDCHFDFIPPKPYDTLFDPDYTGPVTGEDFFFDRGINARMPRRDQDHLVSLYDGEIAWTDHHVGLILDALKSAGLLDETIVAVTSDHGTEFFEHGGKAHRMTLFDEVIRIPLLLRYPALLPAGARVRTQVRIVDIGPTLLELAGVDAPDDVMGQSLLGVISDGAAPYDEWAVSELFSVGRRVRTIRTLRWKFFDYLGSGRRYYIDLVEDPDERSPQWNLADGTGRELLERYHTVVTNMAALGSRASAEPDPSTIPPDVLKQLQSLGYIDGS